MKKISFIPYNMEDHYSAIMIIRLRLIIRKSFLLKNYII